MTRVSRAADGGHLGFFLGTFCLHSWFWHKGCLRFRQCVHGLRGRGGVWSPSHDAGATYSRLLPLDTSADFSPGMATGNCNKLVSQGLPALRIPPYIRLYQLVLAFWLAMGCRVCIVSSVVFI